MLPTVVDPWVNPEEAKKEYDLHVASSIPDDIFFAATIAAVDHEQFRDFTDSEWLNSLAPSGILLDLKGMIPRKLSPVRL